MKNVLDKSLLLDEYWEKTPAPGTLAQHTLKKGNILAFHYLQSQMPLYAFLI